MRTSRAIVALVGLLCGAGCQVARVYRVTYVDPSRVVVEMAEPGVSSKRRLQDPKPGAHAELAAGPVELGPLGRAEAYRTLVHRRPDNAIELTFRPSLGEAEQFVLVLSDGSIGVEFPTATGDLLDFPGFHLAGVTGLSAPQPMSLEDGTHGIHFEFRPRYDTQRALGRTPDIHLSLLSPVDNIAFVQAIERPPRAALTVLLVTSAVTLGVGAFVAWPRSGQSQAARDTRFVIGIPLVLVGGAALGWSAWALARPTRSIEIPVSRAFGAP